MEPIMLKASWYRVLFRIINAYFLIAMLVTIAVAVMVDEVTLENLPQILSIGLLWPLYLVLLVIIVLAASANGV